jgi:hypothetical protein
MLDVPGCDFEWHGLVFYYLMNQSVARRNRTSVLHK